MEEKPGLISDGESMGYGESKKDAADSMPESESRVVENSPQGKFESGPHFLSEALLRDILAPGGDLASLGALARLYIMEGQYLLHYREEEEERYKFLSPTSLRHAFSRLPVETGWLPSGICRWGSSSVGQWCVRFIPPACYTLRLELPREDELRKYGVVAPAGEVVELEGVPLPGMVFMGVGATYYLWAVASGTFHPDLPLFGAPLPNLYGDGRVCFGENRAPEAELSTMEEAWQLFITSPFTAHLAQTKSQEYSEDVRIQLLRLAGSSQGVGREASKSEDSTTYPATDLVPYRQHYSPVPVTVRSAVDSLVAKFALFSK
ncbi:MAG TPA: hypothetical protein VH186_23280 [Chloroflexia bacterium]|nr:hypothetical protein [Chloroflexia bacterium]